MRVTVKRPKRSPRVPFLLSANLTSHGTEGTQADLDELIRRIDFQSARYTDVTYEVKAVHFGYRLTLEYDMFQKTTGSAGSVKSLHSQKRRPRDLVVAWNDNVKKDKAERKSSYPTLLAYIYDIKPTHTALCISTLQGQDRQRADSLEDICLEIGMGLYLATMERTHSGFCDFHGDEDDDYHMIEHEDEDSITLTDLVNLNGSHVASGIGIDEYENIVQSDPFDNGPDEEDFDRYHGRVTHEYKMTVSSRPVESCLLQADSISQVLVMIPEICKSEWLPEQKSGGQKRKREIEVIDLE